SHATHTHTHTHTPCSVDAEVYPYNGCLHTHTPDTHTTSVFPALWAHSSPQVGSASCGRRLVLSFCRLPPVTAASTSISTQAIGNRNINWNISVKHTAQ